MATGAGLVLRKAQRKQAYLKLGMSAPSGGGKTAGALIIGYGLMKEKYPHLSDAELWDKIGILDTENGSGELYVNSLIGNLPIGEYSTITVSAPFTAEKYIQGMEMMEEAGLEVCILDSTTHLWTGSGGLLEKQTDATKRNSGNSYTAWREVTPLHNAFVEKMLQCHMHVIATMRSKTEYTQEQDPVTGKKSVKKLGMNPVQRDGMEYEFTIFFDVDDTHETHATKDRTGIWGDGSFFKITRETGAKIMRWLMEAKPDAPEKVIAEQKAPVNLEALKNEIKSVFSDASKEQKEELKAIFKKYDERGNPSNVNDATKLQEILDAAKEIVNK